MINNNDWSMNYGNEIAMGYLKRALEEYNKHSEEEDKLTDGQMSKICSMMNYAYDLMTIEEAYKFYLK